MDVFFEQLVKVKRTTASTVLMLLSIATAAALCAVLFWLAGWFPILMVGVVATAYGEWKLLGFFHKEFEYIITNGTVDVDRIIAKSTRNRMISFECTDILRIGRYNHAHPPVTDASEKLICGNKEEAYFLLVKKNSRKVLLVLNLNDKMLEAIKTSVPKNMVSTLFSEI